MEAPNGSITQARAILDSASSASFISDRLAQRLHLPRSSQSAGISGVAGLSYNSSAQSITEFKVSSMHSPSRKLSVTAVVVSSVTCDLPLQNGIICPVLSLQTQISDNLGEAISYLE